MQAMTPFITSDTHFGHGNIIRYCSRPFTTCEDMDRSMIAAWNNVVGKDDLVLHVGDVAFGGRPFVERNVSQLNGHKVLVRGNHDKNGFANLYKDLGWIIETHIVLPLVFVVHNPRQDKVPVPDGTKLVVHGHTHGTWTAPGFVDAGVDALGKSAGYAPVPMMQALVGLTTNEQVAVINEMTRRYM
jgi:calcineurin-like phosphoesterase family protein